jgi:hypothetical protein
MKNQLFVSLVILFFLFSATILVIIYGKGYQIDFQKGRPEIAGTGLLVTTSIPDGASVYINDHLTTATNNTINLPPGTYKVKINKEAYFPWEKTIKVEKEVVSKAQALLFSKTPKLESITDLGVNNPVIDPSNTKIAFTVSSQSTKNNGVYIINMNSGPLLTLQGAATQITDDTSDLFSKALLEWSPDGQNLIATITTGTRETKYLLTTNGLNQSPQDITETIQNVLNQWESFTKEHEASQVVSLKSNLQKIISENFSIIAWSPDETKILYTASTSATLPVIIDPPLLGSDSTPQQRSITQGNIYIYDIKEDKNYSILNATDQSGKEFKLVWLPDSLHLFYVHDKKIDVLEYDGLNKTTVYAGPFVDSSVFPWPTIDKFVIVTNLGNSEISPNLYTVSLK